MEQENSLTVFMKNMESIGRGAITFSNGIGNVVTKIESFMNNNSEAFDSFIKNFATYAIYILENSEKICWQDGHHNYVFKPERSRV
ncbi:hypothetical protein [Terribacillus saccharophilus]|uniref:hypothetical protein n=1 Tax=Terribacillus saccharophilus TaxID=361277 RepID=UPI000C99F433|nr:hypothetical protein [Terribacillus goriensis]